jgi:formate-dependent nitrite reductase membrane component NrfD
MLLAGIADQARLNPDCFDCGSETSYAASMAFYFHAASVIAGGVTWLTFGDLHTRVYLEDDKARLVDRLEQTSKGFGVAAIVSGALAALSATILLGTVTSEEPWNNPFYDMQGLFIMGWIQNGIAAPMFAHIAVTNAVIAEQIDAIDEDGVGNDGTAMLRRSRRPRLLSASPFGFSLAF